MDFNNYQYENVFERVKETTITVKGKEKTKKIKRIFARLKHKETGEVSIIDVTDYSIPDIYLPTKSGKYKSYVDGTPLSKKSFTSFDALDKFTKSIKKETGKTITIQTDDGEEFSFPEKVFGEGKVLFEER